MTWPRDVTGRQGGEKGTCAPAPLAVSLQSAASVPVRDSETLRDRCPITAFSSAWNVISLFSHTPDREWKSGTREPGAQSSCPGSVVTVGKQVSVSALQSHHHKPRSTREFSAHKHPATQRSPRRCGRRLGTCPVSQQRHSTGKGQAELRSSCMSASRGRRTCAMTGNQPRRAGSPINTPGPLMAPKTREGLAPAAVPIPGHR